MRITDYLHIHWAFHKSHPMSKRSRFSRRVKGTSLPITTGSQTSITALKYKLMKLTCVSQSRRIQSLLDPTADVGVVSWFRSASHSDMNGLTDVFERLLLLRHTHPSEGGEKAFHIHKAPNRHVCHRKTTCSIDVVSSAWSIHFIDYGLKSDISETSTNIIWAEANQTVIPLADQRSSRVRHPARQGRRCSPDVR